MKSLNIREKFFDFFQRNGHAKVPSSSLIPAQDPTLLFTNAGMNQFKDVFLSKESRSYTKAVSIQKCIRAGGKHNDLENVGFTKRHLTFFEMMGNFSFGDYFKKEAIRYAWDFLTGEMKLPASKLYASVYELDDEAYNLWRNEIGLDESRVVRLGAADNFWQMGDTGPCGPCTEIYIDRGVEHGCGKASCAPGCSCDRFLEIWNLVFMQFNRLEDGTDVPLAKKSVDTGMGLERLTAVMQNKDSVFDTDLFQNIILAIEKHTGHKYSQDAQTTAAFRVLADHIRSSSFAIADGCTPSNEGRGYVLRKIIRRAALFAQKLSDKNFFPLLLEPLAQTMGEIYPELVANAPMIQKLLESEIDRFMHNLVSGKVIFEKYAEEVKREGGSTITGAQAFKLYDTYGFPLELTNVLAQERGLVVDRVGFEHEMERQRLQSGKKTAEHHGPLAIDDSIKTEFVGYQQMQSSAKIIALYMDSTPVENVPAGERCLVITDTSPFFVECGGQISDKGYIVIDSTQTPVLRLQKIGNAIAAEIKTPVALQKGDLVSLIVDKEQRINTMKNHTATHLLQAALISLLGKTVKQSGSVVTPDYLRFDFTYHENLTPEQIKIVEDTVNAKIMENLPVSIYTTTYKDALSRGVIAIFGEKYNPENVRVIDIPDFSKELCGGTHVLRTGDIGCFKINEVSALSAGNRRIVAVTGPKAVELFQETWTLAKNLGQEFKVQLAEIPEALKKQREQLKSALAQIKDLKKKLWALSKPQWLESATAIGTLPFVYLSLKDATPEELREIAAELLPSKKALYFLVSPTADRVHFYITLSPEFSSMLDLKAVMDWLKQHGLSGGGSKTSLQGSGVYIDQKFIELFKDWVRTQLKT